MDDELERALQHDEAIKAQVARNKARNAPPASIPVPPERMARIADAQRLRTQLGGYGQMPPDVRRSENVQRELWPKVVEYVRLRLELAAQATCDALVVELGLSSEEFGRVLAGCVSPSAVPSAVGTEKTQVMETPDLPVVWRQLAELELRVRKLERRAFDTSDVPTRG
jgi:hypothetical protein